MTVKLSKIKVIIKKWELYPLINEWKINYKNSYGKSKLTN